MRAKRFKIFTLSEGKFLLPGVKKVPRCFANLIEGKCTKLSIAQLLISYQIITAFGVFEILIFLDVKLKLQKAPIF